MSIEDNIRKVVPYVPGEQPQKKVIKLNTNECPYPPSPKVIKALEEADWGRLRLYPDPKSEALNEAIAWHYGVESSQVFTGVGSDDVLSMLFLTFFAGDRPILFPDITYSFYDVWAEVYRIPYQTRALKEDFATDPADYYGENGGVVIANPNAPTGIYEGLSFITDILDHNKDSVVIVDEAYIDFGGETALPLIKQMLEYGSENCEVVILEGIFIADWYQELFEAAIELYGSDIYAYYFDISFEETVRRHNTRSKAAEFGADEMRKWWKEKDYLDLIKETTITEDKSKDEIVNEIYFRVCKG